MLNLESYKDGAIEQIAKVCESVTPEDAEVIGDVIHNTLTQLKQDIVDSLGNEIASSVKDRVEEVLSVARSA